MEIVAITDKESLKAVTDVEIKNQIEQAKQYPRNAKSIIQEVEDICTLDIDVALSCFYVMYRDKKPFVGVSVRFAEVIASLWTNIRAGARIVSNDNRKIGIQGFVLDMEKNAYFTTNIERSILYPNGSQFSQEMITQTINAVSSIAFRNAIFKAIPPVYFVSLLKRLKKYITDNINSDSNYVADTLDFFRRKGILASDITNLLSVNSLNNLSSESMFLLIGLRNAVEEGDVSIEEVFGAKVIGKKKSKFSSLGVSEPIAPTVNKEVEVEQVQETKPKKYELTTIQHAEKYRLKSEKPLFVKDMIVSESYLKDVEDFAKDNDVDVIFGIIQNDVVNVKKWLSEKGYVCNDNNNDFYKSFISKPEITSIEGREVDNSKSVNIFSKLDEKVIEEEVLEVKSDIDSDIAKAFSKKTIEPSEKKRGRGRPKK